MRVPLSWLREFVPYEGSADDLADLLNASGLAVEEIIRTGEGISGVVVGEVRAMQEHPNADSLMLVKAFDGTAERDIVCGARNYAVGDRVPLALPGARLPNGMEIAQRKVRGEISDGMLCSAKELHISDDHSGILVLGREAVLGADIVGALALDDAVLNLDITTNRPDCLSIVGVAREVHALTGLPLTVPLPQVEATGEQVDIRIEITDPEGCPRYLARVITGITVAPSPWWMRRRILAAGMRPISNIVDVTNYVLLERGQPLHAFDLDSLSGAAIVVRRPAMGERILTLDGVDRALGSDDVAICDAERPVAVAGVMGGGETEVSDKTTRILLESAYFDPNRIRKTSARLKLRSEASMRFERGADIEGVPAAAALAASLFAKIGGATVSQTVVDVYPGRWEPRTISFRPARANSLLGIEEPGPSMASSLRALGCEVADGETMSVSPPSWRGDLQIEEDLIEEVARIYGYAKIPETLPGGARIGGLTVEQERLRMVRRALLGAGLSEAQTLSLLPPTIFDRFELPERDPLRRVFTVANPLSEEESVLRPMLIPGLVMAAQRNVARRVLPVTLFETGGVFLRGEQDEMNEIQRVAWIMCGPAPVGHHGPERPLDFFDGRGVLEALARALGIAGVVVAPSDAAGIGHPGRTAVVTVSGREAGMLAELHPRTTEALELPGRVVICELDLEPLLAAVTPSAAPSIPRLPPVGRDVALVVGDEDTAASVEATITGAAGPLLESITLFDVYRGEPVREGARSLAYALVLRDPERTLTDEDADTVMRAIADAATARGWVVRE